jgi:phosphoglucosamine mutase
MAQRLFETDGIRALADGPPLDDETCERIGMAAGTHFAEPGESIDMGYDPRESSGRIVTALATGITAVGVNVRIIGRIPTPALAHSTRESDAAAGVMVTASHNKFRYNGIKIFDRSGGKLTDETEDRVNEMIFDGVPRRGKTGSWSKVPERAAAYEDFLVASAEGADFSDLLLGLDTANGASSGFAARVFGRLGANVVSFADQPNGRNINEDCGATSINLEGTSLLQKAVIEQGLDI